jgi:hypothetical protein
MMMIILLKTKFENQAKAPARSMNDSLQSTKFERKYVTVKEIECDGQRVAPVTEGQHKMYSSVLYEYNPKILTQHEMETTVVTELDLM